MAWDRASSLEYDAWATFADSNDWSFDSLFPYFIKSENIDLTDFDKFPGVSSTEAAKASTSFKVDDGFSGPIQASTNPHFSLIVSLTVVLITGFLQHHLRGPGSAFNVDLE